MATDKQERANRENARHSSGPRSQLGKQRSSFNAIAHGLNQQTLLTTDDAALLKRLFEADGFSPELSLELAEAHCARARVKQARYQAWLYVFESLEMDPEKRGVLYGASEEFLAEQDEIMGSQKWRKLLSFHFEKPFENAADRNTHVTMDFLNKQRRLNRYDVKAVSHLSKLYKKAYKI